MSKIKRVRIFAGPNGSGKSTLYDAFCEKYNSGHFINSDLIEKEITEKGFIDLSRYNISSNQEEFDYFLTTKNAKTLLKKSEEKGFFVDIKIKENIIIDKPKETNSYEASLITSFIREKLIESHQSFSFETVMSHPSKIEEIEFAKNNDYKTYFYFICLDDPELNVSRVKNRVIKGGHDVDDNKIVERYSKTLENLLPAIKISDRSFLFDNSNEMELIAETQNGEILLHKDAEFLPNWFIQYVINKIV
jgi:predicted ABC-type ATPase